MIRNNWLRIRWRVGWILLAASVVIVGSAMWERRLYLHTSIEGLSLTSPIEKAVDLRLDQSTAIYQLTAVLIAALWGLIVASDTRARIGIADPETAMLGAASILLIASIVWHYLYLAAVTDAYLAAGATAMSGTANGTIIPDVFSEKVDHLFLFQRRFFGLGFVASVLTLVSANRLRHSSVQPS